MCGQPREPSSRLGFGHNAPMTTTDFTCSGCGGPLTAPPGAGHVDCPFCGVTNAIASAGAVKVAKVLERHGIRMPDNPRSTDDIRAELAERDASAEAARRRALVVAAVFTAVVLLVIGAAMAMQP